MIWLIGIGVVLALSVLVLVFTLAQALRLIHPRLRSFSTHPREYDVAHEDVFFMGPQGKLGAWYLPGTNGRTLIGLHGITDNRQQWLAPAVDLQRRGYTVLMMDFRRHGQSEGRYTSYGDLETGDIAAALDYLQTRGDIDMARVGLMGLSLGAIAALIAAARLPQVGAVMAEAAFGDLQKDLSIAFSRYTGAPAFPLANLVIWWGQRLSGAQLSNIRPVEVIGQIAPRPVFIIGDMQDTLVDEPRTSDELFARAGEPKELWQIPDAGHVQAYTVHPAEYIDRLDAFFQKSL